MLNAEHRMNYTYFSDLQLVTDIVLVRKCRIVWCPWLFSIFLHVLEARRVIHLLLKHKFWVL